MIRTIAAFFLAFGLLGSAHANPAYDLGPAIGSKVPPIGMPQDEAGKPRTLESLAGRNGTVLFFFRSASWCPYCQLQLMDLNGGVGELEKRGYRLAGISYEPPSVDAEFIGKRGLKYPLLSDPKSEIIDRYKLRDPQYKKGSRAYGVPQPVIFVLDRDGVVKAKLYEDTYTKRPPIGLVLDTIDRLNK
ncbi:MAG: peroxiredoxin family protein [Pseudomonadota bacterium]